MQVISCVAIGIIIIIGIVTRTGKALIHLFITLRGMRIGKGSVCERLEKEEKRL